MKEIRVSLYRGVIGLGIGSASGGVISAAAMWFVSWLKENTEEPAWIFAGTVFGLMIGLIGGSILGFLLGLFNVREVLQNKPIQRSRWATVNRIAKAQQIGREPGERVSQLDRINRRLNLIAAPGQL